MLEYVMWGGEGEGRVMRERVLSGQWSVVSGQIWSVVWFDLI